MQYLKLSETFAGGVLNPAVFLYCLRRNLRWHPSVALPQYPDKKRAAVINQVKTEVKHPIIIRLFFRHSPSEVNINQVDTVLAKLFTQSREDDLYQMVSLSIHVPEGGRDKNLYRPPA